MTISILKIHLFFLTNFRIFAKILEMKNPKWLTYKVSIKNKNEVDEKPLNVMQSAQFINHPEVQNFKKN